MTVLDTILEHKREEVGKRRAHVTLSMMKARASEHLAPPPRDFVGALRKKAKDSVALIAEVKKASPSAGVIRADFDPAQIAREYEAAGAACLSVLTDERFFQGHDTFLQQARDAVAIPVLRKDFVVNEYQIYEARALGADAVLLIVAALASSQVEEWGALAQSLGMAALVEVHTAEEMEVAVAARASLIGINARDLKTFATDLAAVERLSPMAPPGTLLVAESGLRDSADVQRVRAAGARAVLVGETFMRSPNIGEAVRGLMGL